MSIRSDWNAFVDRWVVLTLYQRFEQLVTLVLSMLLIVVIPAAIWNLFLRVLFDLVLDGSLDPTDHSVFRAVFAAIIALEFKRLIIVSGETHATVFHVRTVVLVALLALLRQFIILDLAKTGAATIAALALVTLALGGIYWIIRQQDEGRAAARRLEASQGGGARMR
ncbi:phosphate-starvation-inducible PsiE family protein [Rubellimicrobium sp. CFH 75288]|uniref:phosphate-starvation-inducible PsiE family protein n=1 Tax=Rubellimicrobium sp. CFH 75288 TaxID=2697034 RepID=UPI0014134A34|nr:phosphate-starvation-inducible PsiE family protein [Rubellimicrobium sp. CFH 75288]NAZ38390.1 protein PsiE [Rubellimicrobium sp. CFH 75288]